jgi:hypothetical protein
MKITNGLMVFSILLLLFGCGGGGSTVPKTTPDEGNVNNPDTGAPKITLKGDKKVVLMPGDSYQDTGATAQDDKDGDLTSKITLNSNVDYNTPGTYEITYQVKDKDGNTATVVRKIYIQDYIASPTPRSGLVINEVLASNIDTELDPDYGQFSDWIELYNGTGSSIDIGGYYLSDDEQNLTKWKIPNGKKIDANEYLLIWADKEDTGVHTNFKLSDKGETVVLSDNNGKMVDSIKFDKQKSNISCGKINDKVYYMKPTPKKVNRNAYSVLSRSKKPDFSLASGFYDGTQTIELVQENGGKIYYTKDGSTPTENSTPYTAPINVNETTVIKAVSLERGNFLSKVRTKTYFIDLESKLPVVSLSMNDDYLNDDMIGIYVAGKNGIASQGCYDHLNDGPADYKNFNQSWERPVYMEYFDEEKERAFNLGVDISIAGQCSKYNKKKSFAIELDSKYGDKSLKYSLYPSKEAVTKVKDFKLRTGRGGFDVTDILAAMIVESGNLDIDYQGYRAVRMFINGEYWGIYNIREKKGKDYIRSNYPDIDKVDIIAHTVYKVPQDKDIVKSGNMEAFNNLVNYVKTHDLSNDSDYQGLLTMIDKNSCLDYMIFMIYAGASDWLYNNTRFWRERKEGAKWRWMLDDVDGAFTKTIDEYDSFAKAVGTPTFMSEMFKKLLTNSNFKAEFKNRFNNYLNTVFKSENILPLISKLSDERRGYLDGGKWGNFQSTFDSFEIKHIDFVNRRVSELRTKLNQF